MAFTPEEYAQREIPDENIPPTREPLTIQELLDHPERRSELYPDGRTHQDTVNAEADAEDRYYEGLGAEIERHPICSPTLILERQRRSE